MSTTPCPTCRTPLARTARRADAKAPWTVAVGCPKCGRPDLERTAALQADPAFLAALTNRKPLPVAPGIAPALRAVVAAEQARRTSTAPATVAEGVVKTARDYVHGGTRPTTTTAARVWDAVAGVYTAEGVTPRPAK